MKYKAVIAITFTFVALYIGIRIMPVEPCEFLHYSEGITEEGDLEFCGTGETAFYDFRVLKFPLQLQFLTSKPIVPNEESKIQFHLSNFNQEPVTGDKVGISHTRQIHLMLIDSSLEDYHHLHPEPSELEPGIWEFTFTPKTGGEYKAFIDFIPQQTGRKVLLQSSIQVEGESALPKPTKKLSSTVDGYEFVLETSSDNFEVGVLETLTLKVLKTGQKVEFERVMGAYAHMVAFDEDRYGFAHLHPLTVQDEQSSASDEPNMTFGFQVETPGYYRLWAQLKLAGQEILVPFDLEVGV